MKMSLQPLDITNPTVGVELAEAGTRISAVLETRAGIRTATQRNAMPPSPEEAVEQIAGLVRRLDAEAGQHVRALGVAISGRVEATAGVVHTLRYAPGWEEIALAERLTEALGVPVALDSATNAAALAEARRGAGVAYRHVLYVLPAQSVTAAYVAGECILHGATGNEGQLAHLRVREGGPRCSCGAYGHLEPLASTQAIVRNMIGRASGSEESTAAMLQASFGRAEAMSAAQVAALAAEGEPAAAAVLGDALDALATGIACALALLDPDVIVLGGPLAQAGPRYFEQLRERLVERRRPLAPPPLVAGMLEPRAALLGAIELTRRDEHAEGNGTLDVGRGIISET